jgi:RNase H-fold protein (predicted Holliday junction resolvase)
MNKITNPTNAIILLSCDLLLRKSFKNHADKYNTELVLCSNTNQLEQLLNKENYKHVIVSFPLEIEPYDESIITLIHSIDPDIKITLLLCA